MVLSILSFLSMAALATFVALTCFNTPNSYHVVSFQDQPVVREDIKILPVDKTPPATPIDMPTPENPGPVAE